ncbi:GAF domain-containing protein [Rhizobium sp. LjRoot30]|uniref:HWE histidine kinase domain-containing protein n=1 Tax=Rhizobium sp. LjRoot30 TaxID=3342320 RepID=UPI003ECC620B
MQPDVKVDLTNCDREPIHIPGSIQPHGCLLACDNNAATVLRHSENAAVMLGFEGQINGTILDQIVGPKNVHDLRNAMAAMKHPERPALLFGMALPQGGTFDVSIHRFKSTIIIEFEPSDPDAGQPLTLARELIGRISSVPDIDQLLSVTARLTRGMLGYDRVMIYRFMHDGAGQVVSEAKRSDLESFFGQYFPASDIPQQARALYLRNTIRIISDVNFQRIAVVPERDASGEPLDLSFAHLRSVSPIHCEYLRNMGVSASMSISIIVDGALWGLIACHHYAPRRLLMAVRVAAEMFGEFFSLNLNVLQQKRKLDTAQHARRALDRFLQMASHHAEIDDLLREHLRDIADILPCDGVGLWMNGTWSGYGHTPPPTAIPALARFSGSVAEGRIWATHALTQRLPDAETYHADVSGLLVVPLSQIPRDYLFFFRKEMVQTLNWAGNPEKSYESGPLGDRLTPRKSFAIWKELVHMQAHPWSDADRDIAEAIRSALVEIVLRHNELLTEERSKADVRQRMLNEELNHRVKNILAVIKSLVGHPVQEQRSIKEYVASLKGRIQALAFAHDQVVRGDGGGALVDLLNAELLPYRNQSGMITLGGPAVWLDARAFSVMALVLHELSTNAAKYGALSIRGGRLDVTWSMTSARDCELYWRESGGPPVSPPSRQGFGTVLVDRSVPYDLGGRSEVVYAPEGLQARFLLPAKHASEVTAKPVPGTAAGHAPEAETPHSRLAGLTVLLVEDQMLIAMDVEAMLIGAGVAYVATTGSAADALHRLDKLAPDVAVLDVNLGTGTSLPVAEELRRRGIPFVFATGYGESTLIPASLAGTPIIRKPYDAEGLLPSLARLLESADQPQQTE